MLDSRGKTKGGWFFILGFNMLKPNMSNTISIGTCSSDLYIHYFFETSGTASCGTTGKLSTCLNATIRLRDSDSNLDPPNFKKTRSHPTHESQVSQ